MFNPGARSRRPTRWLSVLVLSFYAEQNGGRIELVQINVPDEDFAGVSHGWEKTPTGLPGELFLSEPRSTRNPVRIANRFIKELPLEMSRRRRRAVVRRALRVGISLLGVGDCTLVWQQPADEQARGMLCQHFPFNGTYYVPSFENDEKTISRAFDEGPVAFVHMLAVDGRPMFVPSIMIQGFLLNLAVVILITLFLRQCADAFPKFADRVKPIVLVGLTATIAMAAPGN